MTRLGVIPVPGRHVRRPDGQPLAALGELVDPDPYWARRQRDGDVRFGTPTKPKRQTSQEVTS